MAGNSYRTNANTNSYKTHRESIQEDTAGTALAAVTKELILQSFGPFTFREAGKTESYRCASSSASNPSNPSQTLARPARHGTVLSRLRCRVQTKWQKHSTATVTPKRFTCTQVNFSSDHCKSLRRPISHRTCNLQKETAKTSQRVTRTAKTSTRTRSLKRHNVPVRNITYMGTDQLYQRSFVHCRLQRACGRCRWRMRRCTSLCSVPVRRRYSSRSS